MTIQLHVQMQPCGRCSVRSWRHINTFAAPTIFPLWRISARSCEWDKGVWNWPEYWSVYELPYPNKQTNKQTNKQKTDQLADWKNSKQHRLRIIDFAFHCFNEGDASLFSQYNNDGTKFALFYSQPFIQCFNLQKSSFSRATKFPRFPKIILCATFNSQLKEFSPSDNWILIARNSIGRVFHPYHMCLQFFCQVLCDKSGNDRGILRRLHSSV